VPSSAASADREPQLAEYWLDGMERLNLGGLVGDTE
jgi:hypothetical protein